MKRFMLSAFSILLVVTIYSATASGIDLNRGNRDVRGENSDINIALRLMGGRGSVLRPGNDIRLTYRVTEDAYVIIYNIDSEGFVNLLYPHDGKLMKARKYTVYSLPSKESGIKFKAGDKTGVEYIHALAVKDINEIDREELYFLSQNNRFSRQKRFRTDMDPYLTINMIDESIIRDIEGNIPATDVTYFFVNRRVDFPQYLCEKGCDDVAIERNYYDVKLEYPYPPLFNITEGGSEEYYSYDGYYDDNLSNDWASEVEGYDDVDLHLTINLGGYAHYDPFWSYNYYNFHTPYYWDYDPFFWGFGISSGWYGGYYAWYDGYYNHYYFNRFRSWCYPYGCAYRYYYPGYYRYDGGRSLYAGRSFRRSRLDYHGTMRRVKTRKSIARSRLARTRSRRLTAERMERSSISRALSRDRRTVARKARAANQRRYQPERRVIRNGGSRSAKAREARKAARARSSSRSSSARDADSVRKRSNSSRRSVKRNRPARKRSSNTRAKRSTSRSSSNRKRSSSARKKSSGSSNRSARPARKSTGSKNRPARKSSSARSRSSSRKSSPARSSRRSKSSGGSKSSRSSSRKSRRSGGKR